MSIKLHIKLIKFYIYAYIHLINLNFTQFATMEEIDQSQGDDSWTDERG